MILLEDLNSVDKSLTNYSDDELTKVLFYGSTQYSFAVNHHQGLIWKIRKKGTKTFNTPYSNPFLSVLYQNKALHNIHKRGQCPKAGC